MAENLDPSRVERYKNFLVRGGLVLPITGGVFLLVLAGLVFFSGKPPIYDEPWYLNHVGYLKEYGLGREFLREYPGYAGPLFAVVHWLLEPITGLQVPWVRLVNVVLLWVVIAALGRTMRRVDGAQAGGFGYLLLAAPMAWSVAGLALTEVPAMAAVQCGVLLLWAAWLRVKQDPDSRAVPVLLSVAAGVLVSLGICGRQTYLVLLAAPVGVGIFFRPLRLTSAVFVAAAIALPLMMFASWGGLEPPVCRELYADRPSIKFEYGLLSFGYGAAVMALICPAWFRGVRWWLVAGVMAAMLVVNGWLLEASWVPMRGILGRIFPEWLLGVIGLGTVSLLYTIAIVLAGTLLVRGFKARLDNPLLLFSTSTAFLLLLTPLKITHVFSSRYVLISVPFLMLAALPGRKQSNWAVVRMGVGAMVGIFVLAGQLYGPVAGEPTWERHLKLYYPHLTEGFKDRSVFATPADETAPAGEPSPAGD